MNEMPRSTPRTHTAGALNARIHELTNELQPLRERIRALENENAQLKAKLETSERMRVLFKDALAPMVALTKVLMEPPR